ncbi:MAG: DinB family protein [Actinobacteria bacterium]|nr:MAG: DinB family protein [Actinomycetota bacterium]
MSSDDHPWEPPLAGTEAEHLAGALDRLRATLRWKADDLDAAGLRLRIPTSTLTLGGLLKHLAAVEDYTFTTKLSGKPVGEPWDATGWDGSNDWEFESAADDTPEELYALYDGAVERSRTRFAAALADGGLDQLVHTGWPDGRHISLRRLLCDLIEEYGRHTGHADLLREAVDGRVGEDPPDGWRPVSGAYKLTNNR